MKRYLILVFISVATICIKTNANTISDNINAKYGFSQYDNYGNGYYKVWNNLKWGLCSADGKEIIAPTYDAIWNFDNGYAVINVGAKWVKTHTPKGVTEIEKEKKFKQIWDYDVNSNTIYVYEPQMKQIYKLQGGKLGIIDASGNVIVEPIYDDIKIMPEYNIAKVKSNGKYGYIDLKGNKLTEIKYDDAQDFYDGMAIVNIGGKPNKRGRITGGKSGYINS